MNKAIHTIVTGTLLSIIIALVPTHGRCATYRSGDLLFLKSDKNVIEHVGILFEDQDANGFRHWFVYEAWNGQVQKITLPNVLRRVDYKLTRWEIRHLKKLHWFSAKKRKILYAFLENALGQQRYTNAEFVAVAFKETFSKELTLLQNTNPIEINEEDGETVLDPLDLYLGNNMTIEEVNHEGSDFREMYDNMLVCMPLFFIVLHALF